MPESAWTLPENFATPRVLENESEDEFSLKLEAPGFENDDFKITLEGQRLSISGRRDTEKPDDYKAIRQERSALEFNITRTLPASVNASEIRAELKNGVLTVSLPKSEDAKPRQIKVISPSQED
jgi:HSP20 family protein